MFGTSGRLRPDGVPTMERLGGAARWVTLRPSLIRSKLLTLGRTVCNLVVAALIANKRVFRDLQLQRRVDTTHGNGYPLVPFDGWIPE